MHEMGVVIQMIKTANSFAEKNGAKAVRKLATRLSADRPPQVGLKTKLLFGMMRMMQKKGWGSSKAETEYWRQKGWLDRKRPWKM